MNALGRDMRWRILESPESALAALFSMLRWTGMHRRVEIDMK